MHTFGDGRHHTVEMGIILEPEAMLSSKPSPKLYAKRFAHRITTLVRMVRRTTLSKTYMTSDALTQIV